MEPPDAEAYEVLQYLEGKKPAQWAGKAEQFLVYLKAVYAYQTQWVAANPGKEFDLEDDEHAQWFNNNNPGIDADVIEAERVNMLVSRGIEEGRREDKEKKEKEEKEQKEKDALIKGIPVMADNVNAKVIDLVSSINPELAKCITGADGKSNITPETITMMDDVDPIARRVIDEITLQEMVPMLVELEKTGIEGSNYRLNPGKNPVHAMIDRYRKEAEADLLQSPVEEQMRGNQQFVTVDKMVTMRQAILKGQGTKAEKEQKLEMLAQDYWCLGIDDLEDIITDEMKRKAKARIDDLDSLGRKKYAKNGLPAPVDAAPPSPAPPPPTTPRTSGKPQPPSLSQGSDQLTQGKPAAGGTKTFGEEAAEVMFK